MIKNSSNFKHIARQWEVHKDLKNFNEKNVHVQQISITIISQSSFSTNSSKFHHCHQFHHMKKKKLFVSFSNSEIFN